MDVKIKCPKCKNEITVEAHRPIAYCPECGVDLRKKKSSTSDIVSAVVMLAIAIGYLFYELSPDRNAENAEKVRQEGAATARKWETEALRQDAKNTMKEADSIQHDAIRALAAGDYDKSRQLGDRTVKLSNPASATTHAKSSSSIALNSINRRNLAPMS